MQETQETRVWSLGREDPLEKEIATHSVFLLGKSHGQRSLANYSPWGPEESHTTAVTEYAHVSATRAHTWERKLNENMVLSTKKTLFKNKWYLSWFLMTNLNFKLPSPYNVHFAPLCIYIWCLETYQNAICYFNNYLLSTSTCKTLLIFVKNAKNKVSLYLPTLLNGPY